MGCGQYQINSAQTPIQHQPTSNRHQIKPTSTTNKHQRKNQSKAAQSESMSTQVKTNQVEAEK